MEAKTTHVDNRIVTLMSRLQAHTVDSSSLRPRPAGTMLPAMWYFGSIHGFLLYLPRAQQCSPLFFKNKKEQHLSDKVSEIPMDSW
jgi:hypothetical protein